MMIKEQVTRILEKNSVSAPPVPIKQLIQNEGLRLIFDSIPEDVSGVLDIRSTPTILINDSHHPNRQRFSMAHELGHYLMHDTTGIHVDKVFYRNSRSSEGLDVNEIEANRFAAQILMPEEMIMEIVESDIGTSDIDEEDIQKIADRFKVSTLAMSFRLQNLDYIASFDE